MTTADSVVPVLNRVDALFRESDLENYYLSVQAGEQSFSYCILDSRSNKYIGVGELRIPMARGPGEQEIRLPFDGFLSRVMAALPVLRNRFKSCKVTWEGRKNTLLPDHLFEEGDRQKILSFNIPMDGQEKVFHDRIPGFPVVNIFAMPEKVNSLLTRTFGVGHIPHITSVLITSIFHNYHDQMIRPRVFLNVRENLFDLVVMDQTRLHYANMFDFRNPEDLIYFTLFVLEQLGFSQEQADVVLMGKITRNTSLYNMLFKYIRKLEFARRSTGHEYSFIFQEIPHHAYFPLLNLNQCGL